MATAVLAVALELSGCFRGYAPGSLLVSGPGRLSPLARQIGCVDVRVSRVGDPRMPTGGHGVGLIFGNRCEHAVALDLGRLRVTARWSDGVRERLHAYDPRGEIHAALLEARGSGSEVIAFVDKRQRVAARARLTALCVDVGAIAPAGARHPPPVCLSPCAPGASACDAPVELAEREEP